MQQQNPYPEITTTEQLVQAIEDFQKWAVDTMGLGMGTHNGIYQIGNFVLQTISAGIPLRKALYEQRLLPEIDEMEKAIAFYSGDIAWAAQYIVYSIRENWGNLDNDMKLYISNEYLMRNLDNKKLNINQKKMFSIHYHKINTALEEKKVYMWPVVSGKPGARDEWFRINGTRSPSFPAETALLYEQIAFWYYFKNDHAFGDGKDIAERIETYFTAPVGHGQIASLLNPDGPAQMAPEDIPWMWTDEGRRVLKEYWDGDFDAIWREYR